MVAGGDMCCTAIGVEEKDRSRNTLKASLLPTKRGYSKDLAAAMTAA
jgi:hypothetical protein